MQLYPLEYQSISSQQKPLEAGSAKSDAEAIADALSSLEQLIQQLQKNPSLAKSKTFQEQFSNAVFKVNSACQSAIILQNIPPYQMNAMYAPIKYLITGATLDGTSSLLDAAKAGYYGNYGQIADWLSKITGPDSGTLEILADQTQKAESVFQNYEPHGGGNTPQKAEAANVLGPIENLQYLMTLLKQDPSLADQAGFEETFANVIYMIEQNKNAAIDIPPSEMSKLYGAFGSKVMNSQYDPKIPDLDGAAHEAIFSQNPQDIKSWLEYLASSDGSILYKQMMQTISSTEESFNEYIGS